MLGLKKSKPKKPARANYHVVVNNGNSPGAAIADLRDLGAIAARELIDNKEREVLIRVTALFEQGQFGAQRRDGTPAAKSRAAERIERSKGK